MYKSVCPVSSEQTTETDCHMESAASQENVHILFSFIRLILSILPALTTRHHHCADHDHAEYYCQEIPSESVLCDRHGPVCVRLLHLRLRRTYRVRHAALLCQQQEAECEKGQEEEKPGERLSTTN